MDDGENQRRGQSRTLGLAAAVEVGGCAGKLGFRLGVLDSGPVDVFVL